MLYIITVISAAPATRSLPSHQSSWDSTRIMEVLTKPGGQLAALYREIYIYEYRHTGRSSLGSLSVSYRDRSAPSVQRSFAGERIQTVNGPAVAGWISAKCISNGQKPTRSVR